MEKQKEITPYYIYIKVFKGFYRNFLEISSLIIYFKSYRCIDYKNQIYLIVLRLIYQNILNHIEYDFEKNTKENHTYMSFLEEIKMKTEMNYIKEHTIKTSDIIKFINDNSFNRFSFVKQWMDSLVFILNVICKSFPELISTKYLLEFIEKINLVKEKLYLFNEYQSKLFYDSIFEQYKNHIFEKIVVENNKKVEIIEELIKNIFDYFNLK